MTVEVRSADLVVPMTAPPIEDGAVATLNGRILDVGSRRGVLDRLAGEGRSAVETRLDGVLLPGLVNAHTHLQYSGMAAVGAGRYGGIDDWVSAFNAGYAAGGDRRAAAAEGAGLLLAAGVTAAADVVTDAEAATALADAGLRGIAYWEVMERTDAAWRLGGREQVAAELARMPPGSGLSPHAPYSLDAEPLRDLPRIARAHRVRLHVHLGESPLEGEPVAGAAHPAWWSTGAGGYRALRERGSAETATAFLDRLGVLGPDCHVAHGVHLGADDRALLRARGTAVALCPRSNAVVGTGEPPVAAYLAEGSPVAVGTDSLASSPSLDPMADVAALVRVARAQGYAGRDLHARLLSAATLGGARAMGLDTRRGRIGRLEAGAAADLVGFRTARGPVADVLAGLAEAAPADRLVVLAGVEQ